MSRVETPKRISAGDTVVSRGISGKGFRSGVKYQVKHGAPFYGIETLLFVRPGGKPLRFDLTAVYCMNITGTNDKNGLVIISDGE